MRLQLQATALQEMMRAAQPTAVPLIVVEDPSRSWTAASRTAARPVGWQRTRI